MNVRLSSSRELVDCLHQRNTKVFLISGGFRCIVEHVATQLNIPLHHVYANRLKFYFSGKSCLTSVCPYRLYKDYDIIQYKAWVLHLLLVFLVLRHFLMKLCVYQESTPVLMRASPQPRVVERGKSSACWRSSMASRLWWWLEMEPLIWRPAPLPYVSHLVLLFISFVACTWIFDGWS